AARSTNVLPPFILWASGASLIWITTASASTPRFFTSACVISRIMPAFCSSVRPAAMLTVISGIPVSSFSFSFVMAGQKREARLFVRALDDHAGRVAAVGIFELVAHVLGVAEIKLGADIFVAQGRDHFLIIRDAVAVEHSDHDRPELRPRVELAQHRQRRLQP